MKKRVLVVDDEPNLLVAIAAVLRGEGLEVTTARNGRDALLAISRSQPDLVVSDVRMPVMDGNELARRLRAAPHTNLIPIIFLSAKDQIEDRVQGFRSGVDVYLTKPFEPEELIVVIRSILHRVERTRTALTVLAGHDTDPIKVQVKPEELTAAEWRVAELVSQGLTNKQIGAELDISSRTVENHISHILAKKNLGNRVEITRYFLTANS